MSPHTLIEVHPAQDADQASQRAAWLQARDSADSRRGSQRWAASDRAAALSASQNFDGAPSSDDEVRRCLLLDIFNIIVSVMQNVLCHCGECVAMHS